MHLTQQQQINQMCPPPLGPPSAWFMNHHHHHHAQPSPVALAPQTASSVVAAAAVYHQTSTYHHHQQQHQHQPHQQHQHQHQHHQQQQQQPQQQQQQQQQHNQSSYYSQPNSLQPLNILSNGTNLNLSNSNNSTHSSGLATPTSHMNNANNHHQSHIHQHVHHTHPVTTPQPPQSPYNAHYSYHQGQAQQHQQQAQQQQQQLQTSQPQYSQASQMANQTQQPLTIQQPISQHIHIQQPSPHLHPPQLSPHTSQSSRPSSALHQQPSPNYQQHSPMTHHLTSPSLQPSPILHHTPQPQPSPISSRHQPTPPHHSPTPNLQQHHHQQQQQHHHQNTRPASAKESITFNTSNILQTEVKILELNRRLQCRPTASCYRGNPQPDYVQFDDYAWWEDFRNDFFKEDATLTLMIHIDERPIRYVMRKSLISRFFKSYFDGGVTELSIGLRNSRELRNSQGVILESSNASIITKNILRHPKVNAASRVVVCSEGQLSVEFVGNINESLLIRSWKLKINLCREYIDRSITSLGLPPNLLVEPTTHLGVPSSTMIFLKSCSVIESMQELMSYQKMTNLDPKICLKRLLYDKFNFKCDEETKSAPKRRKRRTVASPSSQTTSSIGLSTNNSAKKSKINSNLNGNNNNGMDGLSQSIANNTIPPMNVMVVSEPSLMSSEYRDKNERSINKVENPNYASAIDHVAPISDIIDDQAKLIPNDKSNDIQDLAVIEQLASSSSSNDNDVKSFDKDTNETDPNITSDNNKDPVEQCLPPPLKVDAETDVSELYQTSATSDTECTHKEPESTVNETVKLSSDSCLEKENNNNLALNDETSTNSTATQSENHYNIMNSIPEDREDTCRSTSCDSIVAKLPPSSNNKNALIPNGTGNKQNRRRSSERKETLREGLMRTSDFVVALKDLKCEHPSLWRITGHNLLQQFEPKAQNGSVLYENTHQYAGWNLDIKRDYVGVDVKLTQHTRNQITVERLLLNFQKLENSDTFYDKHYVIYLQILISTALDSKFWESIENETKHHDYFLTSRRIIEDITKRFKVKISTKLKLGDGYIKNIEKYPALVITPLENDKELMCRACNTIHSTQLVTFGDRTYDLHSYKPVKVTIEPSKIDDMDVSNRMCDTCVEYVKLYSEIHHLGWKLYNLARDKVELHRTKSKPINAILDECLKDEDWLATMYAERDNLWSRVEHIQ